MVSSVELGPDGGSLGETCRQEGVSQSQAFHASLGVLVVVGWGGFSRGCLGLVSWEDQQQLNGGARAEIRVLVRSHRKHDLAIQSEELDKAKEVLMEQCNICRAM